MPQHYPHSLWKIFSTFLVIGLQSFGGGTATFFLIHQTCLKQGWLDEEEFLKLWALSQLTPGIGLVKLTLLLGKRLHGWAGLGAAISGLMLPSALVTGLMTAGYAVIQDQPPVRAAMRGILPAAIGLTLALSWDLGKPLLVKARQDGRAHLALALFLIVCGMGLFTLARLSPVIILLITGGVTIVSKNTFKQIDKTGLVEEP